MPARAHTILNKYTKLCWQTCEVHLRFLSVASLEYQKTVLVNKDSEPRLSLIPIICLIFIVNILMPHTAMPS